jgi:hypothetical protein
MANSRQRKIKVRLNRAILDIAFTVVVASCAGV